MTFNRLAPRFATLATALVVAACGGSGATTAPTQAAPTDAGPSPIVVPTFDLSSLDLPSFARPVVHRRRGARGAAARYDRRRRP